MKSTLFEEGLSSFDWWCDSSAGAGGLSDNSERRCRGRPRLDVDDEGQVWGLSCGNMPPFVSPAGFCEGVAVKGFRGYLRCTAGL